MTHTYRTHTQAQLARLVQEIKVGRSIEESPLTLLPSYSTWNSTTEEAFHRKSRPSVVSYYTKIAELLRMYAILGHGHFRLYLRAWAKKGTGVFSVGLFHIKL